MGCGGTATNKKCGIKLITPVNTYGSIPQRDCGRQYRTYFRIILIELPMS